MRISRTFGIMAMCALPTIGHAQSFGGSFDEGGGQTQPSIGGSFETQPSDVGSDGFGGSFDSGGGSGTDFNGGGQTVTAPDTAVPSPGGDDFNGGSFDQVQPGPSDQQQVQPDTQQTETTTQPDPGIAIDPQILAFESRDFGVPPSDQLRNGQFHGATPTAIPGGQVVSTQALANALNNGMEIILIDVLGGQYSLPNAYVAPGLAQPGNFRDRNQQQAAQWLQQITGGRSDLPIVVYCSDPQCWLSYNAALRTINAGFSQVFWYRGGIQAWQMGGLPMEPAGW